MGHDKATGIRATMGLKPRGHGRRAIPPVPQVLEDCGWGGSGVVWTEGDRELCIHETEVQFHLEVDLPISKTKPIK